MELTSKSGRGDRKRLIVFGLLSLLLLPVWSSQTAAQPQARNINQAHARIRERMMREQGGGRNESVTFNNDGNFSAVDNNSTRVTGTGTYYRNRNDRGRPFNYDAVFNIRDGALRSLNYSFTGGNPGGPIYPPNPGGPGDGPANRPPGRVFHSGAILNRMGNKGLDVTANNMGNGANVQLWTYAGQPNQRWQIIDLGDRTYAIVNERSGRVLDVSNRSSATGANVQQWSWANQDNQRWRLQSVSGGFYQIVSVQSGKCLSAGGDNYDGANVEQNNCRNANAHLWRLGR